MALRNLNRLREGKNLDVRLSTLEKLSEVFGVSLDELLGRTPAATSADKRKVVEREAAEKEERWREVAAKEIRAIAGQLLRVEEELRPTKRRAG